MRLAGLKCGVALQFIGNPDFNDNSIINDYSISNDNSIFGVGSDVSSDFTNPFPFNDITPQTGGVPEGDVMSTYTSSYTGPQGHKSTIANYDNGRVDQVTDNNGHISHFTRNIPGKHQSSYLSLCYETSEPLIVKWAQ
ncbi:hypothetical protein COCOBI_18-1370 [Coccomyxa sp. Obi]|nr:hypothetical protein COCOBI_18-1370 [Coccomyxa sp. Obi]